jgi:dCTP deaminase
LRQASFIKDSYWSEGGLVQPETEEHPRGDVLSGAQLRDVINRGELGVSPILDWGEIGTNSGQFGPGSFDVRLSTYFAVPRATAFSVIDASGRLGESGERERFDNVVRAPFGKAFVLHPGQFALAYTLEYFSFPAHLMGYVIGRSSWGRLGLIIATATMVNPSFRGVITLELANVGNLPIVLYPCMRIAQLVVHRVDNGADAFKASGDTVMPAALPDEKYTDQLPGNRPHLYKDRDIPWVVPRAAIEIIGLVGPTKSGKSLVATHFLEKGYRRYSLASIVRDIARERGISDEDVETLQGLGDQVRKEKRNAAVFAERVAEVMRKDRSEPTRVLVTGFKNTAEVRYFLRDDRFKLIALNSTYQSCLERWKGDGDSSVSDAEVFDRVWHRDFASEDVEYGQDVKGCLQLASIKIENSGSKRALLERVEMALNANKLRGE